VIRIGPSGWAYKDWEGIVYPAKKPKGFDRLAYLSQYFDAIEINTSFYGSPRGTSARSWAHSNSSNPHFRFTAKLLRNFTHERNATAKDESEFKDGMASLMETGRFGALLLLQFPWSFRNTPENRAYIAGLHRQFSEFPLVLEVRHATWAEPEILDFLVELDIGLCNIDQPLFHRSIQPGEEATSGIGYVRLHGRNYGKWFSKTALSHERYDYLYTPDELEPWVERIRSIGRKTKDTYAMSNNHHVGKAIANGFEITAMLTGRPVAAPESLVARYPELRAFGPDSGR
jgi:uncharacterized protein YecE (DUF72 family)